jgi:ERCC4-type nuclease
VDPVTLIVDTCEPWPHPWAAFLPEHVRLERATLETGDFALAGLPDAAVVERKTVSDCLACMTSNRERFEWELARSRHVGAFVIIVEGSLSNVIARRGEMTEASLLGTVAAWTRRFAPIIFADNQRHAAELGWRFLVGQLNDAHRIVRAASQLNPSKPTQGRKLTIETTN